MTTDSQLLASFARTNSEDAFAELVQRHVHLVHSAALRQVNGDAHLAQDVAQTVFTDLARKASSLARREVLTGWLYTSAHFAAAKIIRTENRRRDREEKFMREPIHETAPERDWEKLRPVLDAAMHELKETDREAILLRYFENRQFAEVGAKLGLNENAARMRVERALEKLRGLLAQRGMTTATALSTVISANAVQLAPAGLAATLTTASIVSAGTGTFTLMKMMTATKLKLGISALVVVGAATAFVLQHQAQEKLRTDNEALTQQLVQLQTDNESLSNRLATTGESKSLSYDKLNELLKLRGEVGVLQRQTNELVKLREENREIRKEFTDFAKSLPSPEQALFNKTRIQTINATKYVALAMRMYAADNNDQYPTNLDLTLRYLNSGYTNGWGGISINSFEMINIGSINQRYPQMLMLRELTPRQAPDGTWERVYGLADGSVQTISGNERDFADYEKQHSPPPNQ